MSDDGMQRILKQAREMQAKQNRRLAEAIVESTVADGRVQGKMNGHRVLISLRIDPSLVAVENRETIERSVVELVNDLVDQMDKILERKFGIVDKMPSISVENMFGRS